MLACFCGASVLVMGLGTANAKPPSKIKKVVIDAGHGGKDPGCSGKHSVEKFITLEIALKLGAYIEDNMTDVEVIYTRKSDVFVTLNERAAIANRNDADVFISIHCNAVSGKGVAHGTETYVMGLHRSDENLAVAKRENSVIMMEDNYLEAYDGFDPNAPETHIVFNLYTESNLKESTHLAKLIEDEFSTRAGRKSRGVKQAGLVVLYKSAMPAVLVETGFLSNKSEEAFLLDQKGQSYLASAIYRAFRQYKEEVESEGVGPLHKPPVTERIGPISGDGKLGGVTGKAKSGGAGVSKEVKTTKAPKPDPAFGKGVKFRVQLYDSDNAVDLGKADIKAVGTFEIDFLDGGKKCYLVNEEYEDRTQAENKLKQMKKAGFPKARIVQYKDGNRLSK